MMKEKDNPLLTQEELDALFGAARAGRPKESLPAKDASGDFDARGTSGEIQKKVAAGEPSERKTGEVSPKHVPKRSATKGPGTPSATAPLVGKPGSGQGVTGLSYKRPLDDRIRTTDAFHTTLEVLSKVPVTISVQAGKTSASLKDISAMQPGTVLGLDTLVNEPVRLLIGDVVLAEGELVEIKGYFGVKIRSIKTVVD
jgi:flagellar motor switch/type III secretory pathway protein FliN